MLLLLMIYLSQSTKRTAKTSYMILISNCPMPVSPCKILCQLAGGQVPFSDRTETMAGLAAMDPPVRARDHQRGTTSAVESTCNGDASRRITVDCDVRIACRTAVQSGSGGFTRQSFRVRRRRDANGHHTPHTIRTPANIPAATIWLAPCYTNDYTQ